MGLVQKNKSNSNDNPINSTLTRSEIVWLLELIKSSTFEGKDVQTVYETVVKLQLRLREE